MRPKPEACGINIEEIDTSVGYMIEDGLNAMAQQKSWRWKYTFNVANGGGNANLTSPSNCQESIVGILTSAPLTKHD